MVVYFYSGVVCGKTFDSSVERSFPIASVSEYQVFATLIKRRIAEATGHAEEDVCIHNINRL